MKAAAIIALLAGPALADGHFFLAPTGCTGFLTVQSADCTVENYWTCAADPEGYQWRLNITAQGPQMLALTDAETQWVQTHDLDPPYSEKLVLPAADPASFSELLETGNDSFDFMQEGDVGRTRIVGFDMIAEDGIVIDGEPLKRTNYSIREVDLTTGEELYRAEGSEYISTRHRRFFSGYGDVVNSEGSYKYNSSPVEFIYPGEPGYFSKTPKYGCGANLASYPAREKE